MKIKNVTLLPPKTIIGWDDGTTTQAECGFNDSFDEEKGVLLCIAKKFFGNTTELLDAFKMAKDSLAKLVEEKRKSFK